MHRLKGLFLFLTVASQLFATTQTTLNVANYQDESFDGNGICLTSAQDKGGSAPAYNSNKKDLRLYAKNTLTLDAGTATITSISFTLSDQGKKALATITASVGSITENKTPTLSWSGNASKVTFTVGDKADYGTSPSSAGQLCFTAITLTLDKAGTCGSGGEIRQDYTFTQGYCLSLGTAYSTTPNFQIQLASAAAEPNEDWSEFAHTEDGSYAAFDIFTSTANSIVGTYTVADSPDYAGGMSKTYSMWDNFVGESDYGYKITSGTLTITCVDATHYSFSYNLTDIQGFVHSGHSDAIYIPTYNESNQSISLANNCKETDISTIRTEESQLNILIYDLLGKYKGTNIESLEKGIYIVIEDGKASKISK